MAASTRRGGAAGEAAAGVGRSDRGPWPAQCDATYVVGMSVHSVFRGCLVVVLCSLACGPSILETGTDTSGSTDDAGTSSGSDSQATTGSPSDPTPTTAGETDPTGGPPEPSTGEPPDTTSGEPVDCPKGQTPFAARWATVVEQPELGGWSSHSMVALADGRIAVSLTFKTEANERGYGLFQLTKDGELLGTHLAPLSEGSKRLVGFAVDDQQRLVMLGNRLEDMSFTPFLARFATDGPFLGDIAIGEPNDVFDGKLALLDTPLILGRQQQDQSGEVLGVKLDGDDVGSQWAMVVDASPGSLPKAIATRGDGEVLFVSGRDFKKDDAIHLQAVDSAGEPMWSRTIEEPFFGGVRHATAIPGGWVVLRGGGNQDWPLRLLAIAAADGATQWEIELAATTEAGPPMASRVHLTGDHLTIPVIRTLDFEDLDGPHTVAAHRVALDGTPIDETPLWEASLSPSVWDVESAIGACGELLILSASHGTHLRSRVGAYVP